MLTHWPKISGIISDLDGVTYRGDEPIESAVGVFQRWNDIGLPYAFVTNNSTKSAEEFSVKLNAMGIPADPARIVTTSAVAAVPRHGHWCASTGARGSGPRFRDR